MAKVSNLDILEEKISRALDRINQLKEENRELRERNGDLEGDLASLRQGGEKLQARVDDLTRRVEEESGKGADLNLLKGRVDDLLSKFEELDI